MLFQFEHKNEIDNGSVYTDKKQSVFNLYNDLIYINSVYIKKQSKTNTNTCIMIETLEKQLQHHVCQKWI